MSDARLYTGAALVITGLVIRATGGADWSTPLLIVVGVILMIISFAPEEAS